MIRCHRDPDGFCRVDPIDVHPLVGTYLEQDVQGDLATCDDLVRILDEVEQGRCSEWSGTGNVHTLTIRKSRVSIENEWDDSLGQAQIPLSLFRQCVVAWRQCIAS